MLQSSARRHRAVQRRGHRRFAVDHRFHGGAQLARFGRSRRQEIQRALTFRHGLGAPGGGFLRGRSWPELRREPAVWLRRAAAWQSRWRSGTTMPAPPARRFGASRLLRLRPFHHPHARHRLQLRGQRAIHHRRREAADQRVFRLPPAPRAAVFAISIPGTTIATGHCRFRYGARRNGSNFRLPKCVSFFS